MINKEQLVSRVSFPILLYVCLFDLGGCRLQTSPNHKVVYRVKS